MAQQDKLKADVKYAVKHYLPEEATKRIMSIIQAELTAERNRLLGSILKPENIATTWVDTQSIEVVPVSIINAERRDT